MTGKKVSWEQVEAFSHMELEPQEVPRGVVGMMGIGVEDHRPWQMPSLQVLPAHWLAELQGAKGPPQVEWVMISELRAKQTAPLVH